MKKVFWIKPIIFAAILLLIACNKEKTYLDSGELEYKVTHWPVVKTLYVTNLTSTAATLNGTVKWCCLPTTVTFEYYADTSSGKGDIQISYSKTVTASQSPVADTGLINVSADISGLSPCLVYHFRIKAENSLWKNFYGDQHSFSTIYDTSFHAATIHFNPNLTYGTVSDIDGNSYKTILIGTQTWMAENLRTTRYADGTAIPLVSSDDDWRALTYSDKAYCWFNIIDCATSAKTYGALYTWTAAMNGAPSLPSPYSVQGVCPTGWHLPSDEEWTTLTDYLGGIDVAGAKLMETDTIHWNSSNILPTNESGFTALPGGHRSFDAVWWNLGNACGWWSSTEEEYYRRWYRAILKSEIVEMFRFTSLFQDGFSVRCLKGIPTGVATTMDATNISANGATLNGYVPANNISTTVTFEYGTSTSYGQEVTAEQNPVTGNTETNVSVTLTGLTIGTAYHFRIKTVNDQGTVYGSDRTFITLGRLIVTTEPVTNKTTTGATLNGTVNAGGLSTIVTFEYGNSTDYGQEVTAEQSPVTGITTTNVSTTLTGLAEGTYHVRIKAVNPFITVYGSDIQFTVCQQFPIVSTLAATNISSNGAILNGTVNANGSSTIVTFEYGVWVGGKPGYIWWRNIPAEQSPVTGTTLTNVSTDITGLKGLSSGTRHPFRVKAENSCGIVYGKILSFTLQ